MGSRPYSLGRRTRLFTSSSNKVQKRWSRVVGQAEVWSVKEYSDSAFCVGVEGAIASEHEVRHGPEEGETMVPTRALHFTSVSLCSIVEERKKEAK